MVTGAVLFAAWPVSAGGPDDPVRRTPPRVARQAPQSAPPQAGPSAPKPQPRPNSSRVEIDAQRIRIDDGDTIVIVWGPNDEETVRILGIDCPETRHPQHDIPYGQAFGEEARAFATGAFATATKVELLRASMLDPYGRTLGYLFLNGRNYSVLVIAARLAEESVTRYGDNGFPTEAKTVADAAKLAGPPPFEPPGEYRLRMRNVTQWMKAKGMYPGQ